jgi:hypothetical protein
MIINKETQLYNIQLAFSEKFPFLKIEFFHHPHGQFSISPPFDEFTKDSTIGAANPLYNKEVNFWFDGRESVTYFEKRFFDEFGIGVQVYRKSGTTWIQTSKTDSWSLDKQQKIVIENNEIRRATEIM